MFYHCLCEIFQFHATNVHGQLEILYVPIKASFSFNSTNAVYWGVVGRERVGTAFPHIFHVLLQNEFELEMARASTFASRPTPN